MNIFKKTNKKGLTFFDYLQPCESERVKRLIVKNYNLKRSFQRAYQKTVVWKKRRPRGKDLYYSTAIHDAGRVDKRLVDLNADHDSREIITTAFAFWVLGYSQDIFDVWVEHCRGTRWLFFFGE